MCPPDKFFRPPILTFSFEEERRAKTRAHAFCPGMLVRRDDADFVCGKHAGSDIEIRENA
jgi:hypothetical protein